MSDAPGTDVKFKSLLDEFFLRSKKTHYLGLKGKNLDNTHSALFFLVMFKLLFRSKNKLELLQNVPNRQNINPRLEKN